MNKQFNNPLLGQSPPIDTTSSRASIWLGRLGWICLSVAVFSLFFGGVYRLAGVDVGMFRAESGLYLAFAYANDTLQSDFISRFILTAYNGHFTPLIFGLEFVQAKIFQANSALWFWRQMIALSLLAASLGWLAFQVFRFGGGKFFYSAVSGFSVAIFFIAQPIFLDLAAWPFMAFQFICLALMGAASMFLVRFIVGRRTADLTGFLLSAYSTMHASGVGAAISAAALVTSLILIAIFYLEKNRGCRETKSRLIIWVVAAILTVGHGLLMVSSDGLIPSAQLAIDAVSEGAGVLAVSSDTSIPKIAVSLAHSATRYGALFEGSVDSSIRSLWANGGYVWPRLDIVGMQSVYGAGMVLVFLFVVIGLGAKYVQQKKPTDLVSFGICAFAFSSLLIYTSLVIFRLRTDPDDAALLAYFIGARYLVFPTFFLVVFGVGLSLQASKKFGAVSTAVALTLACTALTAEIVFARTLMPDLWPHLKVNHQATWDKSVQTAREKIDSGQPVDNINLSALGGGFPMDVKTQRFLLEHQLGCSGCVKFANP